MMNINIDPWLILIRFVHFLEMMKLEFKMYNMNYYIFRVNRISLKKFQFSNELIFIVVTFKSVQWQIFINSFHKSVQYQCFLLKRFNFSTLNWLYIQPIKCG